MKDVCNIYTYTALVLVSSFLTASMGSFSWAMDAPAMEVAVVFGAGFTGVDMVVVVATMFMR